MKPSDAFMLGVVLGVAAICFFVMMLDPKLAPYGQCEEACAPQPVEFTRDPQECWCVSPEAKTRAIPKTWEKK